MLDRIVRPVMRELLYHFYDRVVQPTMRDAIRHSGTPSAKVICDMCHGPFPSHVHVCDECTARLIKPQVLRKLIRFFGKQVYVAVVNAELVDQ